MYKFYLRIVFNEEEGVIGHAIENTAFITTRLAAPSTRFVCAYRAGIFAVIALVDIWNAVIVMMVNRIF